MSDVIAIEEKDITVSNLIDISRIDKSKINLIVAGTGSGKSHYALRKLPDDLNIKPEEILLITSRSITKGQHLDSYCDVARPLDISCIDNYYEALEPIKWTFRSKEREEYDNRMADTERYIHILTYNQFENTLEDDLIMRNIKLIVLDEIHAIFSDCMYIKAMGKVLINIEKMINKGIIILGMTATDDDMNEVFKRKCNYLLDKPFFPNKITDSFVMVKSKTYVPNIIENLDGNTLCMVYSSKYAVKLADKYPNAKAIVSKNNENKLRTKEMDNLEDHIVKYKMLPDDCNILIGTSCIREGFEFKEEANIKNVIIYSGDPVTIKQFVGRYRGNVKNVYIVYEGFYNTPKAKESMTKPQQTHFEEFKNAMFTDKKGWFNYFSDIVVKNNQSIIKWIGQNDIEQMFIDYICENWIDRLIYTREHKKEIVSYAHSIGLAYKPDKKNRHNFLSLMKLIQYDFEFLAKGEELGVGNELIQKYIHNEVIDKKKIQPYIIHIENEDK